MSSPTAQEAFQNLKDAIYTTIVEPVGVFTLLWTTRCIRWIEARRG
jgi:hypothetical protein